MDRNADALAGREGADPPQISLLDAADELSIRLHDAPADLGGFQQSLSGQMQVSPVDFPVSPESYLRLFRTGRFDFRRMS